MNENQILTEIEKPDFEYSYNGTPEHLEQFKICNPLEQGCAYWVAAKGETFGLKIIKGSSCLANVQSMISQTKGISRNYEVYVIWPLANKTPSTWKRWQDKWAKRSANGNV